MIKKLKEKANHLLLLLDKNKNYIYNKKFTKMCLFFQSKQSEHMENIILLEPTYDYYLIARSMIEGVSMLYYAKTNPEYFTECWENSLLIKSFILEKTKEKQGIKIFPETINELKDLINKNCIELKAKKSNAKTINIDGNYYYKDWFKDVTISKIIETCGEKTYKYFWSEFSGWHHWDSNAISDVLFDNNESIKYNKIDSKNAEKAITVAINCLARTMIINFENFNDKDSYSQTIKIMQE